MTLALVGGSGESVRMAVGDKLGQEVQSTDGMGRKLPQGSRVIEGRKRSAFFLALRLTQNLMKSLGLSVPTYMNTQDVSLFLLYLHFILIISLSVDTSSLPNKPQLP